MNRIVTLTTDFGLRDGYVAAMKGVILSINPNATIVDITHDIAPQSVQQGAFVLAAAAKYFPSRTIHVVVVDPGVGSARRPIAIQTGESTFVAPDNGVLGAVVSEMSTASEGGGVRAVHLDKPEYWLPRVSNTFHGRDIFAPCAAHLSLGVPIESLGDPVQDWIQLATEDAPQRVQDVIEGSVIHVDRFGNAVTNVGEELLQGLDRAQIVVEARGARVHGIQSTYAAVDRGQMLALIGSNGHLELAVRDGNVAARLGLIVGDTVRVTVRVTLDRY
ncbi:MAG: SAM-dependent chlorinase/fluorinase [Chloroflexi bacterium]|nr:SAM-dependent chlorinase/fluorinase [Chloroflexota bacterium]